MEYRLPYGNTSLPIKFPDGYKVDMILPVQNQLTDDPIHEYRMNLESNIKSTIEISPTCQEIAIAICDKTRPVPHAVLLPPLLKYMANSGIPAENIHFYIASGNHVPMRANEFERIIAPEIIAKYPIHVHDCDKSPLIKLGITSYGTPVFVNRDYFQADIKFSIGNLEPHHFMGYSGGSKIAAIGLAGRETINHNHSYITHPCAITGHYNDNPMRQDVEEIGKMIGVHFSINAVLNYDKRVIRILCGNPVTVMEIGIPISRALNEIVVADQYDLVIVSPGGYPKDINFYQSQKSLTHAGMITRNGGDILLLAECIEGSGSITYEQFIRTMPSHADVMHYFSNHDFILGPHKALLVARDGSTKNLHLYSSMTESQVQTMLIHPIRDPQFFVNNLLHGTVKHKKIAIMPNGTSTIPSVVFQKK